LGVNNDNKERTKAIQNIALTLQSIAHSQKIASQALENEDLLKKLKLLKMKYKLLKNSNPHKAAVCKQQIVTVTNILLGPYGDNDIIDSATNESTYTEDGYTNEHPNEPTYTEDGYTNEHPNASYANGSIEINHPLVYNSEVTDPLPNTMETDNQGVNPKVIIPFGI
jgi:hypothetical protein